MIENHTNQQTMNNELIQMIHDNVKEVKDDVKNIYRMLNGNGHDGLTHKVDRNSAFRVKIERREYRLWGVMASLAVGIAVALFKLFIQ